MGLFSTIKTGELQNGKTDIWVSPTFPPLTSPQVPVCTQAARLKLKIVPINTTASVTSMHTKCHCSGFWLQLWVPGVWGGYI